MKYEKLWIWQTCLYFKIFTNSMVRSEIGHEYNLSSLTIQMLNKTRKYRQSFDNPDVKWNTKIQSFFWYSKYQIRHENTVSLLTIQMSNSFFFIYIYLYLCVSVCVCVDNASFFCEFLLCKNMLMVEGYVYASVIAVGVRTIIMQ